MEHSYALERLYEDQDHDWVVDCVPALVAWLPKKQKRYRRPPFLFRVRHGDEEHTVEVDWSLDALARHDPSVTEKAERLRSGQTVHREHLTETASYGLALVAISIFLPQRRVVSMNKFVAPDFLLDVTPGAVRGVEVAGRTTGGQHELQMIADGPDGKRQKLMVRKDVVEVYLSLWCKSPYVSLWMQVKP